MSQIWSKPNADMLFFSLSVWDRSWERICWVLGSSIKGTFPLHVPLKVFNMMFSLFQVFLLWWNLANFTFFGLQPELFTSAAYCDFFFFFAFLKRFPSQRKTGSLLSCDIEWKVAKLQKQKTMATDLQPNNLQMWIFSVFWISPYWIVQWFCKQLHFDRRHIMFQSCCHRI